MVAPVKAFLQPEMGGPIPCMFNPAEIQINKRNTWRPQDGAGSDVPQLNFQKSGSGTMRLNLTFDTTQDGVSVAAHTNRLLALMELSSIPGLGGSRNAGRPPYVRFHWGGLYSFKMVITRLSLKFTYFGADGTPLRAKANLRLKQFEKETFTPLQNPTSHTPSSDRVHVVQAGETIDRIAASYYRDATAWRRIATANDITDPLDLDPGTELVIPTAEAVSRGT